MFLDHMRSLVECIATNDAIHTRAKLPDLQKFSLDPTMLNLGLGNLEYANKRPIAQIYPPFKFASNGERYRTRRSAPVESE
jgi:hypothetical protein